MADEKVRSYRIRTNVGDDSDSVINVKLEQTYDMLEILSLKLTQTNAYKLYSSGYGVVVGRVVANGGFGVPNAKVSVFVPMEEADTVLKAIKYPYTTVNSSDRDGVRYNLLPDYVDSACHQDVGTFPNKRRMLDNGLIMEVFEQYYKFTTTTNEAGDYMLFGVPTGQQTLHVDVDLSDIGMLSQRPRDLVYKGYNINQFESPNKFKTDTNLNSLSQIKSQDRGIYVYPFWGDTTGESDEIGITRCDIQLDYKFEPTCVFMGSVVTDTWGNAIGKNCAGARNLGKMSDLVTGEGSIEMIRKTIDGKVEEFPIKGNRVIDGDGVWCYQIPMNLDYVMTDEYGNIVPTDDPNKGIPTRTRVRFRISLDDSPNDATARKRCRYLVPNNPRLDKEDFPEFTDSLEPDYEFGSNTREESYVDLFWNNVYTVKNFIPRFQKNNSITDGKHTGIKGVNYFGDNNPMPYNNLSIKLGFIYRLICVIVTIFIYLVWFLNFTLTIIDIIPCSLYKLFKTIGDGMCKKFLGIRPFCFLGKPFYAIANVFKAAIVRCIGISSEFCEDAVNRYTYYIGCESTPLSCAWEMTDRHHSEQQQSLSPEDQTASSRNKDTLLNCVQNSLAQDNECTKLNFHNDWINGSLYLPLWYRHIRPKKSFLFGLFKRRAKDEWCSADRSFNSLRLFHPCSVEYNTSSDAGKYENFKGKDVTPRIMTEASCGDECLKSRPGVYSENGYIVTRENSYGQIVYYYKPLEYDSSLPPNPLVNTEGTKANNMGEVKLMFATDIVLLGSLNDCDLQGIPQFFKFLESSTYNKPDDMLFADTDIVIDIDSEGNAVSTSLKQDTEMTGMDWSNRNGSDQCKDPDGGLFYRIGCADIKTMPKSCINLSRICEIGVALDETKSIDDLTKLANGDTGNEAAKLLIPDGFVSYDELYGFEARSMFATLNGNRLHTKLSTEDGLKKYDFRYLYPENFDGSLRKTMDDQQKGCSSSYKHNHELEKFSQDYYRFRMGDEPYYYIGSGNESRMCPRYENSFYFYFGLKVGKTAIDKFNSQFFAPCESVTGEESQIKTVVEPNSWCADLGERNEDYDGYVIIDMTGISTPFDLLINGDTNRGFTLSLTELTDDVILLKTNNEKTITQSAYSSLTLADAKDYMLQNGKYTITVTDADGNISSASLDVDGKKLSYGTDKADFTQPNNVLLPTYGSLDKISMVGMNNVSTLESERKFDGYIVISHLWDNKDNDKLKNATITITCDDSDVNNQWNGGGLVLSVGSAGDINGPSGYWFYDDDKLYVGVPIGDVSYRVKVAQQCWNEEEGKYVDSGNVVVRTINVAEPTPLKLFINGIDYDLISDWKSGLNGNGTAIGDGNVVGWLDIKKSLMPDESSGAFAVMEEKWLLVDGYKDIKENEAIEDETERASDLQKRKREFKEAMVEAVKEAFWITCPDDGGNVRLTGRTSNYPVYFNTRHKAETVDNDDNVTVASNYVSDEDAYKVYSISDINVPTISHKDSLDFGNETYKVASHQPYQGSKVSGGTLRYAVKDGVLKGVYMVDIMDSSRATKPDNLEGDLKSDSSHEGELNGKYDKLFQVVLIDKMMNDDLLAWAYFNKIPFYYPSGIDGESAGKYITMNGILAGKIYNGVASGMTEVSGIHYTDFDTCNVEGNDLLVRTVGYSSDESKNSDIEESLPTERYLCGLHPSITSRAYSIGKYIVVDNDLDNGNMCTRQYAPLSNRTNLLDIEGSNGCGINMDISANMIHVLSDVSVNDCRGGNSATSNLTVGISNDNAMDTDNTVTYVLPANKWYPLSSAAYSDDSVYIDEIPHSSACDASDLGDRLSALKLFNYETSQAKLEELWSGALSANSFLTRITSPHVDEDGNVFETLRSKAFGDAMVFTIGSLLGSVVHEPVYLVSVNEDNVRTISPVYDFSMITAGVKVGEVTVVTEVGDSNSSSGGGGDDTPENVETPAAARRAGEMVFGADGEDEGGGDDGGDTPTPDPHQTEETKSYKVAVFVTNVTDSRGNSNLYYLDNYSYKLHVICKPTSIDNIEDTETVQKGTVNNETTCGHPLMLSIDENQYKVLKVIVENRLLKRTIASKFETIEVTDVTGLRHLCGFDTDFVGLTDWFGVTWYPNGGTWTDDVYAGTEASRSVVVEKGEKVNIYQIINIVSEYSYPIKEEGEGDEKETLEFLGFSTKYDAKGDDIEWPAKGEEYDYKNDPSYDVIVDKSMVIYAIFKPTTLIVRWIDPDGE